ncbi:MAG TPA: 6-phosphogluconolactonase [Anaerohalosphaeraceae bacterium]|mgnify:CR=1 FL=1|nr:6-phosphogluconolactonase [Anaerohalosphaeraceae bacterium]
MRFLAIDHGDKRTGLAICDASEQVVSPLTVLEGAENSPAGIRRALESYRLDAVVVGLPYNMDGTEGPRAAKVRRFAEELRKSLPLPILFFDERLSSFEAQEKLSAMELTRKKRKKRLDAVAAAAILEGFLEARKQALADFPGRFIRMPDEETLAQEVLSEFLFCAQRALKEKGRFAVAVCGGRTPRRFFELLSQSPDAQKIDWENVYWFWTDERAVSPSDAASNYRPAAETFLKTLRIPQERVYRMEGEAPDLQEAAADYEKKLREVFGLQPGQVPGLDLVLLGVGTDGHIASLFPGSPAISENRRLVQAVEGPDGRKRLSLTIPVIQKADSILVVLSGKEKAPILCTLLTHPPAPALYPAHCLWPVLSRTVWVADAAAASLLGERSEAGDVSGL